MLRGSKQKGLATCFLAVAKYMSLVGIALLFLHTRIQTARAALLPTVTVPNITNLTPTSVDVTYSVTNDGGAPLTARGFCWSDVDYVPASNPTCTNDGTSLGSLTKTLTGYPPNKIIYVTTYATNNAGLTGYGGQQFTSLPGIPTNLIFSNVGSTLLRVSWTAPSGGATSYKVERCQGSGCSSYGPIASGITNAYYDNSGLSAGTTYRYQVGARNAAGYGSYSASAEVTTNSAPVIFIGSGHTNLGVNAPHDHTGASVTDVDNNLSIYEWSLTVCPAACPFITANASGAITGGSSAVTVPVPRFTPNATGNYTFQLKVTDTSGASDTKTVIDTAINTQLIVEARNAANNALIPSIIFDVTGQPSFLDNQSTGGTGSVSFVRNVSSAEIQTVMPDPSVQGVWTYNAGASTASSDLNPGSTLTLTLKFNANSVPTVINSSGTPNPANVGQNVSFSVSWTDPDELGSVTSGQNVLAGGELAKSFICRNTGISPSGCDSAQNTLASTASFADNLLSSAKTYAFSPSPGYPDSGGQLTNGTIRNDLFGSTEATVGWNSVTGAITIDLGSTQTIYKTRGYFGGGGDGGIQKPASVAISVSTDNVNYTNVNTVTYAGGDYNNSEGWIRQTFNPVPARWVRFTVAPRGWTMIGEFQVYGPLTTSNYTTLSTDSPTLTYYAFVCDDGNLCSSGVQGTVTVNRAPTLSSATDSPDPVNAGSTVTFPYTWADADAGEQGKVHFCKTNAVTLSATGGSCPGGFWAENAALGAPGSGNLPYTAAAGDAPTISYWAFACDDGSLCSAATPGTVGITGTQSPTVTTPTKDNITATSAELGATVTSDGGSSLWERGTCWGTSDEPTINCWAEGGNNVGDYSHVRSGMSPNTLYYYRGYATNVNGTSYTFGDTTFTTKPDQPGTPTFTNKQPTSVIVNWTAPTNGATSYKVERCQGSGCSIYSQIASGVTNTYYDDSDLSPGTTYRYRVLATNVTGDGDYSVPNEVTTSGGVNHAPTAVINAPGLPLAIVIGRTYRLTGTGSDEDGDAFTYAWTVNQGASGATLTVINSSTVDFTANQGGSYQVKLTVTEIGPGGLSGYAQTPASSARTLPKWKEVKP